MKSRKDRYYPPFLMPVTCPNCKFQTNVPIYTVVDGETMPEVVYQLVAGALNLFQCPQCRTTLAAEVPVLYHHATKQVAYLYFPSQSNLPMEQRQRMIGDITQAVMKSLPQEHPKAYLLQPREFLSFDNFIRAVMEVQGIDEAEIREAQEKVALVDKLFRLVDDPVAFAAAVGQYKDKFDAQFFAILRSARDQARATGHEQDAEKLEKVRQKLLPLTPAGRRERAYDRALAFLQRQPDRKQLLEALLAAEDDEEVTALVTVARPLADYPFFQMMNQRIEEYRRQGLKEKVEHLERLRSRVLEITERLDAEARQVVERKVALLRELMTAPDLDKAVEAHAEEIDDTFLFVLQAERSHADEQGLREVVQQLDRIWEAITRFLRRDLPPEVALVETLLSMEYPQETRAFLEQHRDQVTEEVLNLLDAIAGDLERRGYQEDARRVRGIRAQAFALMAHQAGQ